MNEHETSANIIADMRTKAECAKPYDDGIVMMLNDYADRLEAAYKREKAAIEADALSVGGIVEAARKRGRGDRAKLREVLKRIVAASIVAKNANAPEWILQRMADIFAMATTALAAPPRNCDRFATETDAQIAFLREVWLIGVGNLDRDPFDGWTNEMKSAYSKWLFAPATEKEGGAS